MSSDSSDRPSCEDFSIAETFGDPERIRIVRAWFESLDSSEWRGRGNDVLVSHETTLTPAERDSLLIGLLSNGASERASLGASLGEIQYRISTSTAEAVLYEQEVAARVLNSRRTEPDERSRVEVLTAVPPGVEISRLSSPNVTPLAPRLRRTLLEAQDSVRIANPYFDSGQRIVRDVLALPRKGVKTEVLTRQPAESGQRQLLNEMYQRLDLAARDNFSVRYLYEVGPTGRQAKATHAKLIVADDEVAYVGSANFTATSLRTNFELGVLLRGPRVDDVARVFDEVYSIATEVRFPIE